MRQEAENVNRETRKGNRNRNRNKKTNQSDPRLAVASSRGSRCTSEQLKATECEAYPASHRVFTIHPLKGLHPSSTPSSSASLPYTCRFSLRPLPPKLVLVLALALALALILDGGTGAYPPLSSSPSSTSRSSRHLPYPPGISFPSTFARALSNPGRIFATALWRLSIP